MKTVFVTVDGRDVCVKFTYEQLGKIGTFENLVEVIKKHFNADDVKFLGFGEF